MEPEQQSVVVEARSTVERLALPNAEQVEWVSRRGLQPEEFARASIAAVETAVRQLSPRFSPMLRLRLAALVDQLRSMFSQPDAMLETPAALLQDASWTVVRQLAEVAAKEPGWPDLSK